MSSGMCLYCTFLYSACAIGLARKYSLISADMKCAPSEASEIVLVTNIFVSMRFAVGEPTSSNYASLSPLTVIPTQYCSVLSGL